MKKVILFTLFFCMAICISQCKKENKFIADVPKMPATPYVYNTTEFQNLQNFGDNSSFNSNINFDAKATLGRVLFYDRKLSINNTVACGSCHKQQFGFADNAAFTEGFGSAKTLRNSMSLVNLINKTSFFWDGRATTLEDQSLMPIRNHVEMGLEKIDVLPVKLSKTTYYSNLFSTAFGDAEITNARIAQALTAFMRSIVSVNAAIDNNGVLGEQEKRGQFLFANKFHCSHCHIGNNLGGSSISNPYFGGDTFNANTANAANIGLDDNYKDGGIGDLQNASNLNGFFMIPSLRNVELTAPYMHDGRFNTLEEVVEHYNSGIKAHPGLDKFLLQNNFTGNNTLPATPVQMNMTASEKADLVAFLKALTDRKMTNDPKFSNPFKY